MKKIIFLLPLIAILALFGCDRELDSSDPMRPFPEDRDVPKNLTVTYNDESITLNWDVVRPSAITKYYIYSTESEEESYYLLDSSTALSHELSNLIINRIYYFKISSIYPDGIESARSSSISARISHISMTINNGVEFTNNRNVQLQVTAPLGVSHIIFSEDSTFSDAQYQVFSASKSYTIESDGDGPKTVYARLQFSDGGESGDILSDEITLDTKVWIDSVFFNPTGQTFAPGDTIVLGLDGGEIDGITKASFNGASNLVLLDDGIAPDDIAADGVYHGRYIVPIGFDLYQGTVTGEFTDRAGNRALNATAAEYLNINTPTEPVTLSGYLNIDQDTFMLNWTRASGNDFVSYRVYMDSVNSSVDETNILMTELTSAGSTSFDSPAWVGTTYFRVFVIDKHGTSVGSNTVSITKE